MFRFWCDNQDATLNKCCATLISHVFPFSGIIGCSVLISAVDCLESQVVIKEGILFSHYVFIVPEKNADWSLGVSKDSRKKD